MTSVVNLIESIVTLFVAMAPWLLIGFFVAGLLSVLLPKSMISRHLSGSGTLPVIKATLLGIPLPLCSCGVIPVAAHIRKQGASTSATASFLASTPSTGVDSIFATWALLGPIMAIFRPLYALVSGLLTGVGVALVTPPPPPPPPASPLFRMAPISQADPVEPTQSWSEKIRSALHYGLIELVRDVQKWLLIGVAIGGLISFALPAEVFTATLSNPIYSYLAMLVVGIPMYICATGSIPIASALIAKGMSPGAGFVFLSVGPATNAATIAFIIGMAGRRAAAVYLIVIAVSAIAAGVLLDVFFADAFMTLSMGHIHPEEISSVSILAAAVLGGIMTWNTIILLRKRARAG